MNSDKVGFILDLKVESKECYPTLRGKVTFYLHDSFSPDSYTVSVKQGIAVLTDLVCYEAFTVGASCDNNSTKLELDLNKAEGYPEDFYY